MSAPSATTPEAEPPDVLHHFVDEAGDPNLFNAKGERIVETLGCSRFFMMGVLEVDEPDQLAAALSALRADMLADPYFAGVESFKPERKKTALLFHAKDDIPEVRREVFRLLSQQGPKIRFHAVVADKHAIAHAEQAKRTTDPKYRYRPDSLYDHLTGELFSGMHRFADEHRLCVAKRGNKERNEALKTALAEADAKFADRFGLRRPGEWTITVSDPLRHVCLQATDYFLWAVQRFYEARFDPTTQQPLLDKATGLPVREDRYLNLLWPQITEVHDLHHGESSGTRWTHAKPLTLVDRFPGPKTKRPRI
jgi:hypothetical protein